MQDAVRTYATEILSRWASGDAYEKEAKHEANAAASTSRLPPLDVEDELFEHAQDVMMRDDVMLAITLIVIVLSVIALWKVSGAVFHVWECAKSACAITVRVVIWSVLVVVIFFYFFNEEQRYHVRGLANTTSRAIIQHKVYNWSREMLSNYTSAVTSP